MLFNLNFEPEPVPYFVRGRIKEAMALSDSLRKSVLFIGVRQGDKFKPRATGFLCSWLQGTMRFQYLVTAEHVISGLLTKGWEIWASVNMQNGDVGEFKISHDQFCFHPDEASKTDVAVCGLSDVLNASDTGEAVRMDVRAIPLNGPGSLALTQQVAKEYGLGVCDEIAILGLFRSHFGNERNIPIARMGNIACMREEPVFTDYAGYIDAYLVEARSIGGLSGSPVFFLNTIRPVRSPNQPDQMTIRPIIHGKPLYYLMGLVHGHFDIKKLNEDTVVEDERDASSGINTGIGVVVPVEKIIETIEEHPNLVQQRRAAIEKVKKEGGAATADMDDVSPTNDANPNAREDFSRLLNKAATTKKDD
jgi:hypothetical protein